MSSSYSYSMADLMNEKSYYVLCYQDEQTDGETICKQILREMPSDEEFKKFKDEIADGWFIKEIQLNPNKILNLAEYRIRFIVDYYITKELL